MTIKNGGVHNGGERKESLSIYDMIILLGGFVLLFFLLLGISFSDFNRVATGANLCFGGLGA